MAQATAEIPAGEGNNARQPEGAPDEGVVEVWAWRLDREGLPEHSLCLSEREKADRFHFPKHRRRYVAAHVGLRGLLGAYLDQPPKALTFRQAEFGKPSLDPKTSGGLSFNLSHSGELAVAAVMMACEIGADVERHRPVEQAEAIARRHFTAKESAKVEAATGDAFATCFFDLWTAKEAVIKLLGSGLRFPLTDFETPDASGASGAIALPAGNPLSIAGCWLERFELAQGFSSALATPVRPALVKVAWLDLDALAT